MNPIDFNRWIAELDNHESVNSETMPWPDYYNDLNLLMPLAWKHNISLFIHWMGNRETVQGWMAENDNYVTKDINADEAIRQCLIKIYEETKT